MRDHAERGNVGTWERGNVGTINQTECIPGQETLTLGEARRNAFGLGRTRTLWRRNCRHPFA
jgi:hypothetical protein